MININKIISQSLSNIGNPNLVSQSLTAALILPKSAVASNNSIGISDTKIKEVIEQISIEKIKHEVEKLLIEKLVSDESLDSIYNRLSNDVLDSAELAINTYMMNMSTTENIEKLHIKISDRIKEINDKLDSNINNNQDKLEIQNLRHSYKCLEKELFIVKSRLDDLNISIKELNLIINNKKNLKTRIFSFIKRLIS